MQLLNKHLYNSGNNKVEIIFPLIVLTIAEVDIDILSTVILLFKILKLEHGRLILL